MDNPRNAFPNSMPSDDSSRGDAGTRISHKPSIAPLKPDQLLTEGQAAPFAGTSIEVLREWRVAGAGPVWSKSDTDVVEYRLGDLLVFLDARRSSDLT